MNMSHHGCAPNCQCGSQPPTITTPDGSRVPVQMAPGSGKNLCWGIAGGEILDLAPATNGTITIVVGNYSWLKPRKLTITARSLAAGELDFNPARFVTVVNVQGVGRQVIGSVAGVNGGAIDAYADNALRFGADVPPITSSNAIQVVVSHNYPTNLEIAAQIEGEAQQ